MSVTSHTSCGGRGKHHSHVSLPPTLHSLSHPSLCLQARNRLPGADEVIEVTPELLESVAVVSEQLAMATDMAEGRGLLPLDLEATNDIVAQVGYNILAT